MAQITLSDLFSHRHNPYPFYAQLREQEPLAHFTWQGGAMWIATTYDDVVAILKDPRLTLDLQKVQSAESGQSSTEASTPPYAPLAWSRHLLNTEPPDHTRLRHLVSKAFTPRMIEQLRPRIQQTTDELLNMVQHQGKMDLIADFAFPLPITVISEMLGIPTTQRMSFRSWTQEIIQGQGVGSSPEQEAKSRAAEQAFIDYIKVLLAEKRVHPDNDLTSELVRAEENGDTFSESELISMIFLLIVAGHETTVNLIGNGTLALLQHPDQIQRLRQNPSLISSVFSPSSPSLFLIPSSPRRCCSSLSSPSLTFACHIHRLHQPFSFCSSSWVH